MFETWTLWSSPSSGGRRTRVKSWVTSSIPSSTQILIISNELREDSGYELREDGGREERE